MNIALLTDFGTADYFVGAMKGVILTIAPRAVITDITHEIGPQNIRSGAFVLSACFRDFPAGTVFLAVVDPGVGSRRRALAAAADGYYFVGPDNGIFSFVFEAAGWEAYSIENEKFRRADVSGTFHGRDIFAPAAAHIAMGVSMSELGPRVIDPVIAAASRPGRISRRMIRAEVIHTDRFGNLITDLTAADLSPGFSLQIAGRTIDRLYPCFADAAEDEIFLVEGSSGRIEIAVRNGSAARVLGVKTGAEAVLQLSG